MYVDGVEKIIKLSVYKGEK